MANKKFSELDPAAALTGDEILALSQAGVSKKTLLSAVKSFLDSATATLLNKTLTAPVINSPTGIVKGDVGLGNVDNTSDISKPVSTAQAAALAGHTGNTSNPHGVTKTQVGLSNADNTSDLSKPISTATQTALDAKISSTEKGAASGVAPLGADSKIAAAYLPSYVDDVVEAATFAALPVTGETGKIYVTLNDNKTFRWSGSAYAEISASPGSTDAVTEGATNLYFTAARVLAAVLTGLSTASGAVITAADSVLSSLGKLQKQVTDNLSTLTAHIATKDASGGFAGLTLFNINFKNALNTVTSFFTNANTAARTYTFQDRNGTIADDTDLALLAPKLNPTLTSPIFYDGLFNNTSGPETIAVPDGFTGDVTVTAVQGGIGTSDWVIPFVKRGGTLEIGAIRKTVLSAEPINTATIVSNNLQIAVVAGNTYLIYAFTRKVALGA